MKLVLLPQMFMTGPVNTTRSVTAMVKTSGHVPTAAAVPPPAHPAIDVHKAGEGPPPETVLFYIYLDAEYFMWSSFWLLCSLYRFLSFLFLLFLLLLLNRELCILVPSLYSPPKHHSVVVEVFSLARSYPAAFPIPSCPPPYLFAVDAP